LLPVLNGDPVFLLQAWHYDPVSLNHACTMPDWVPDGIPDCIPLHEAASLWVAAVAATDGDDAAAVAAVAATDGDDAAAVAAVAATDGDDAAAVVVAAVAAAAQITHSPKDRKRHLYHPVPADDPRHDQAHGCAHNCTLPQLRRLPLQKTATTFFYSLFS